MVRDALFTALADDTSRAILTHSSETDRSAEELAESIDASITTIYRRLEHLTEQDLLREAIRIDKAGNHRRVYRAAIRRIEIELADERIHTRVEWDEDMADRFTRLWEGLRGDD